jgi:hypothetical protein
MRNLSNITIKGITTNTIDDVQANNEIHPFER